MRRVKGENLLPFHEFQRLLSLFLGGAGGGSRLKREEEDEEEDEEEEEGKH